MDSTTVPPPAISPEVQSATAPIVTYTFPPEAESSQVVTTTRPAAHVQIQQTRHSMDNSTAGDSRTSQLTGHNGHLIDKADIGLKVVYQPANNPGQADVDVIAVHGLGAHPEETWKDKSSGCNWIQDESMLPKAIPNTRILRYGYDANWGGEDPIKSKLPDMARDLLADLKTEAERQDHPRRPLVFICHCFGGLIVEKAIFIARTHKSKYPEIFKSCRGLVLMGTPHRGTGNFMSEALALILGNASTPVELSHPDILHILEPTNETRIDLVEDFTKLILDGKVRDRLQISCFFEKKSIKVADLLAKLKSNKGLDLSTTRDFAVNRESAILDGYDDLGRAANHFQLNKFSKPDDGEYKRVVSVIVGMVKGAMLPPESSKISKRAPSLRATNPFRSPRSMPPYERDHYFEDRDTLMTRIAEKLEKSKRATVVLLGKHGFGKTYNAIEFAHRYGEKTPTPRIFWVEARTFGEFKRSYTKIGHDFPGIADSENDSLDLMKSYLSAETQGPWLLVLDGVDDLDSKDIQRMQDCIPSSPLGAVLVTTCKRTLARSFASESDHLELLQFQTDDIFPFFQRQLEHRVSKTDVGLLVTVLKGHPIALVQAAAYINACPKVTTQQYSEMVSAHGPAVINEGILVTTHIAIEHIQNTEPFAAELARTTCMFDIQTVPRFLLRFYDARIDNFCTLMKKFALMDTTIDKGAISVNHLVRSSIRAIKMDQENLTSILAEKYPALDIKKAGTFSPVSNDCGILLPYAEAILRLEANPTTKDEKRNRATLLFKIAKYSVYLKRYKSAVQELKESLGLREEEIPQPLQLVNETKVLLKETENLAKSSKRASTRSSTSALPEIDDCLKRARSFMAPKELEKVENQLLKHHQDFDSVSQKPITDSERVIEAYRVEDALALVCNSKGQHEKALTRHEFVHRWCLKQYGREHLETARQVFKIAQSLDSSGKYPEAEAKYRDAWEITKVILEESHPEASRILCSLATVMGKQGNRVDAEKAFKTALSLQEQDPGPWHVDTLMTRHNYAIFILGDATSYSRQIATKILLSVLEGQLQVLGYSHPATLRTAVNLARQFLVHGMNDKALELCRFVLPWQEQNLGLDNPETIATKDMITYLQR
ncbi:hypothetical protein BP6252_13277 [Coleophoma cylindrospora]|uniref:NB-ARC domain-containing protein n=1 Tax=Coleophoma cylindrospora TaxID=1849047 RepID=A0A3D8QAJ9_9HELO|nr:hypothetical protein BP6252_13277 [Coleophoma cylindrospora]